MRGSFEGVSLLLKLTFHYSYHILTLFGGAVLGKQRHTDVGQSRSLAEGRLLLYSILSDSFSSQTYQELAGNSPLPTPSGILEPIQKAQIQK